jgi:CP family cyanate transporter-like MFS transporter
MTASAVAPAPALPSTSLHPSSGVRGVLIPLALFGMYASFGAAWMSVVPLFPELKAALGVDTNAVVGLVTVVALAKSVVPIAAGLLAARIGLTSSMRLAAVLCTVAVGAPWLASFEAQLGARVVFGIGGAMWFALMGAVVVDVVAPERRGFVNALNGVAINTGAIVGLKAALPLKEVLGHQGALTLLSSGTVVFAAFVFLCGPLSSSTTKPTTSLSTVGRSYRSVLRERMTWVIAAAFAGPLALYLIMNTWLSPHLEATFGMSRAEAASWLSTMNLWGIPASLVVGTLLQRNVKTVRLHILAGALALPVGVFGALTVDATWRSSFFAIAGIGMFLPVAPLVTALQRQPGMTAAKVGMVMGTMGSVTYIVSSLAPNVVGAVVQAGIGLSSALLPCCLLGLTPLLALALPEPRDEG